MKVIARIPFAYMHQDLDRGELTELRGSPRDNLLLSGVKYFVAYDPVHHEIKACDSCGRKFLGHANLLEHRKKPNCNAVTQEISKKDWADVIEVDPTKVALD